MKIEEWMNYNISKKVIFMIGVAAAYVVELNINESINIIALVIIIASWFFIAITLLFEGFEE